MDRFTWKAPDGTYQIDDYRAVKMLTCFDEDFKNAFDIYEGIAIDKLGRYEDLEEQERLVILPCKIGTPIFIIGSKYRSGKFDKWVNTGKFRWSDIEKLGKTVFLNREEAEAALEVYKNA